MIYIALIGVVGILLLQATGAIPPGSVGGPMAIALVFFLAALAIGLHEAWAKKRGVLGWIVNIAVSLVGASLVASFGGDFLALLLSDGSHSLAAGGGLRFSLALVGGMLLAMSGAWGAIWIVNRWRKS